MAKKKAANKSEDIPKIDGELEIEPLLMERLLRKEAEIQVAALTSKLAEAEWQKAVGRRTAEIQTLNSAIDLAKKEYRSVVRDIEVKYNIELNSYAHDSTTGKLVKVET